MQTPRSSSEERRQSRSRSNSVVLPIVPVAAPTLSAAVDSTTMVHAINTSLNVSGVNRSLSDMNDEMRRITHLVTSQGIDLGNIIAFINQQAAAARPAPVVYEQEPSERPNVIPFTPGGPHFNKISVC